jgi:hypothetical protein
LRPYFLPVLPFSLCYFIFTVTDDSRTKSTRFLLLASLTHREYSRIDRIEPALRAPLLTPDTPTAVVDPVRAIRPRRRPRPASLRNRTQSVASSSVRRRRPRPRHPSPTTTPSALASAAARSRLPQPESRPLIAMGTMMKSTSAGSSVSGKCPKCHVGSLVRIQSHQKETYGLWYVKCSENIWVRILPIGLIVCCLCYCWSD